MSETPTPAALIEILARHAHHPQGTGMCDTCIVIATLTEQAREIEDLKAALCALNESWSSRIAERERATWEAAAKWWDDTERRAAEFHAVYQTEAHRRGDIRHADEYAALPEPTKEWDRVLVRWVATSLRARAAVETGGEEVNTLTRRAYQALIDEDLAWLRAQPRTLAREHIMLIVEQSPETLYGDKDPRVVKS